MQTIDFELLPLQPSDRVLDLGCGEGRHAILAYAAADVCSVAVDLNFEDLLATRKTFEDFNQPDNHSKTLSIACADGYRLPFADNSFDKIICSEVLEHLFRYTEVLQEIDRVLKPGGAVAVSVPRFWPEWICWALSDHYHQLEGGHVRIFRIAELQRKIEQLGFRCYARHGAHALHSPYWWLQCLLWNNRQNSRLVRGYHKLLVWDLMKKPWITRMLERMLNPLMGKSVVLYFRKGVFY